VKLYLTAASLNLRRAHRELFLQGEYLPLWSSGERATHVVAFARRYGGTAVIAVVPRLVATIFGAQAPLPPPADAWRDLHIEIPDSLVGYDYSHVFTGERVTVADRGGTAALPVADVLRHVPVALLLGTRTAASEPGT
jgi:(1->4)-alpha-D-glucan 1-alpha-D-glucosylmutase